MRLLFLLPRAIRGGVWTQINNWAESLSESGHYVMLGTSAKSGGLRHEFKGNTVLDLPLFPSTPSNFVRSRSTLNRLIMQSNIELIHSHHRFSALVAGLSRVARSTPIVSSVHDYQEDWRAICRYWTGDLVVVPSFALRSHMMEHYKIAEERIAVVQGAVSEMKPKDDRPSQRLREEFGLEAGSLVISFVGRLDERKGGSYFIQSIPRIKLGVPKAKFLIAGDGPEREKLVRLAGKLSVLPDCFFLGERSDIPALMGLTDILVVPSVSESFGIACLEAMRSSKPVVASNVGGLPEIISDGVNGALVSPKSPDEIAKAVTRMAHDPGMMRKLGEAGRRLLSERFDPAASISSLMDAYSRAAHLHCERRQRKQ